MSVPLEKIIHLIDYLDCKYSRNSSVCVGDIVDELQKLVDEEEAHLEKMAKEFEQEEAWKESRQDYVQIKLFDLQ